MIVLITPLFALLAVPGLVPVAVAGRCLRAATDDPLLASLDTLAPLILRDACVVAEAVDVVAALPLDFAALACVTSVIVECFCGLLARDRAFPTMLLRRVDALVPAVGLVGEIGRAKVPVW